MKVDILLITGRGHKVQNVQVQVIKLIKILRPISKKITWITNKRIENYFGDILRTIYVKDIYIKRPFFLNFLFLIMYQLRITLNILKNRKPLILFAFGADLFFIPILIGKLLGCKIIIRSDGRPSEVIRLYQPNYRSLILPYRLIEFIGYSLCNKLIIESPINVQLFKFQDYKKKISIAPLFVDTSFFTITKSFSDRSYDIGYFGRLSQEKGIIEFIDGISQILAYQDCKCIIMGSGPLKQQCEALVASLPDNQKKNIMITGFIPDKEVPLYLNDVKFIILPSHYEGFPNTPLESMACGCIVLATEVGGVSDIIKDGETGFLIHGPKGNNIVDAYNVASHHQKINYIIAQARSYIERVYSYETIQERYSFIFQEIR